MSRGMWCHYDIVLLRATWSHGKGDVCETAPKENHYVPCHALVIRNQSLGSAHTWGEGNTHQHLEQELSELLGTYVKTTIVIRKYFEGIVLDHASTLLLLVKFLPLRLPFTSECCLSCSNGDFLLPSSKRIILKSATLHLLIGSIIHLYQQAPWMLFFYFITWSSILIQPSL